MCNKIVFILILLITQSFSSSTKDIQDYDAIRKALTERDDLFTRVLGNYQRDGYPTPETISNRLSTNNDTQSPWYYLLKAETNSDKQQSYQNAITAAGTNIGELWGLFIEFHKRNEREQQTKILDIIEKHALELGIEVLPALSEQLKLLAESENIHHRYDVAAYCLKQSKRFSQDSYVPTFTELFIKGSATDFFTAYSHFLDDVRFSWKTQARIVQKSLHLVFTFGATLFLFLFFMLLVRFYSKAIHPLTCMYPLSIPYRMRFFFTTLLIIVAAVFGIYPVLIFLVVLLLRVQMEPRYAIFTKFVAVLFLLAPISGIVDSRFGHALSDNSPLIIYETALYNQPTPALYNKIKTMSEISGISKKEQALYLTSMALIQYKRNDMATAVALIRQAHTLWPNNEQVLLAAGAIYHAFGDSEQSFTIFKNAIDSFPNSPQVNYNFGQINLEKVGISDGATFISKAAELSPRIINGFIKRNSHYFGEREWPEHRNYFLGAISPETFWDNFAFFSKPPKGTINTFWGATFLGLPVFASLAIVIAIYIISSLIVPTHMQLKKMGECVLCGKPVCKKCRANDFCNECQGVLQNISNEALISSLKIKIADSKRILILTKAHLSDIVFPGTRDFFLKTKSKKRIFVLLPITFLVYSLGIFATSANPTSFATLSQNISWIFTAPSLIYWAIFALINTRSLLPGILKGKK